MRIGAIINLVQQIPHYAVKAPRWVQLTAAAGAVGVIGTLSYIVNKTLRSSEPTPPNTPEPTTNSDQPTDHPNSTLQPGTVTPIPTPQTTTPPDTTTLPPSTPTTPSNPSNSTGSLHTQTETGENIFSVDREEDEEENREKDEWLAIPIRPHASQEQTPATKKVSRGRGSMQRGEAATSKKTVSAGGDPFTTTEDGSTEGSGSTVENVISVDSIEEKPSLKTSVESEEKQQVGDGGGEVRSDVSEPLASKKPTENKQGIGSNHADGGKSAPLGAKQPSEVIQPDVVKRRTASSDQAPTSSPDNSGSAGGADKKRKPTGPEMKKQLERALGLGLSSLDSFSSSSGDSTEPSVKGGGKNSSSSGEPPPPKTAPTSTSTTREPPVEDSQTGMDDGDNGSPGPSPLSSTESSTLRNQSNPSTAKKLTVKKTEVTENGDDGKAGSSTGERKTQPVTAPSRVTPGVGTEQKDSKVVKAALVVYDVVTSTPPSTSSGAKPTAAGDSQGDKGPPATTRSLTLGDVQDYLNSEEGKSTVAALEVREQPKVAGTAKAIEKPVEEVHLRSSASTPLSTQKKPQTPPKPPPQSAKPKRGLSTSVPAATVVTSTGARTVSTSSVVEPSVPKSTETNSSAAALSEIERLDVSSELKDLRLEDKQVAKRCKQRVVDSQSGKGSKTGTLDRWAQKASVGVIAAAKRAQKKRAKEKREQAAAAMREVTGKLQAKRKTWQLGKEKNFRGNGTLGPEQRKRPSHRNHYKTVNTRLETQREERAALAETEKVSTTTGTPPTSTSLDTASTGVQPPQSSRPPARSGTVRRARVRPGLSRGRRHNNGRGRGIARGRSRANRGVSARGGRGASFAGLAAAAVAQRGKLRSTGKGAAARGGTRQRGGAPRRRATSRGGVTTNGQGRGGTSARGK